MPTHSRFIFKIPLIHQLKIQELWLGICTDQVNWSGGIYIRTFHNGKLNDGNYYSLCLTEQAYHVTGVIGMKYLVLLSAFFLICSTAVAKHNSDHPLTDQDWKEVMDKVVLLEDSGLMPTLLPVIMRNRDTLELTDQQVSTFRAWRKKNYTRMVNVMNEIIEKSVQFRVAALSPDITSSQLYILQSEIQELQRQLLKIKLSCRELIITSFTDQQWENFAFVVADNPKLASLMSLVSSLDLENIH